METEIVPPADADAVSTEYSADYCISSTRPSTAESVASSPDAQARRSSRGSHGRLKPHRANNDAGWDAILRLEKHRGRQVVLSDFALLEQLGQGDMGTVYLAQLKDAEAAGVAGNCYFAMKIMNKAFMEERNKGSRCATERQILADLDHPFLPTLYASFESKSHYYLVLDFCSGGDLHVARQLQPEHRFSDESARFYVAEVVLALEYLHMKGIIYRDLKPENVLIRQDGHIMLTDFDLAMLGDTTPTVENSQTATSFRKPRISDSAVSSISAISRLKSERRTASARSSSSSSTPRFMQTPAMFFPKSRGGGNRGLAACVPQLPPRKRSTNRRRRIRSRAGPEDEKQELELIAEPAESRSMSFVGTYEYLAPEIIRNEGHGSAVDWWTLGIFLYELIYGVTPFSDPDRDSSVIMENVVKQGLRFPDEEPMDATGGHMILPGASPVAKDLMRRLLVKEPGARLGSYRGSADIKRHPFFLGLPWHLVRNRLRPPLIPQQPDRPSSSSSSSPAAAAAATAVDVVSPSPSQSFCNSTSNSTLGGQSRSRHSPMVVSQRSFNPFQCF